jgi:hypothetical protein
MAKMRMAFLRAGYLPREAYRRQKGKQKMREMISSDE